MPSQPSPNKRPRRAAVRQHPLDLFRKEEYEFESVSGSESLFRVTAPAGHFYFVDIDVLHCTCPSCKFQSGCKHLDAMRAQAQLIADLVAAQPALYARAVRLHRQ